MSVRSAVGFVDPEVPVASPITYIPLTLTATPAFPVSSTLYTIYSAVLPAGTYLVNVYTTFSAVNTISSIESAQIIIVSGVTTLLSNRYRSVDAGSNTTQIALNVNNYQFVSTGSNGFEIKISATDNTDTQVFFYYTYANLLKVA